MSGNFVQNQFKVNINATAFELLINKLYKDKAQSIIRELLSNAWDAHVDAGTTHLPVQITTPSELKKELIIKDFGTGLPPEKVMDMYCTLFMSDRTNSNDFLGGYGLGCKSPFSYTDQYTVQSRWQHVCHTFSIFKNPEGIPTVAKINETPTDENNGLTIIIPVKKEDIVEFITAANKVLPWFPNIVSTPHAITTHTAFYKSDNVAIYPENAFINRLFYAKIGHVLYEIDTRLLNIEASASYRWKSAIVINVPIGILSITPSRESLAYDEKTIHYLNNAINAAREELQIAVRDIIIKAPTYKEANVKSKALRITLQALEWWDGSICKNGQPFTNYIDIEVPNAKKIGYVSVNNRGRHVSVDFINAKTTVRSHVEKPFTIFYADPSLKYIKERLKQCYAPLGEAYLIISNERDHSLFNDCTTKEVEFIELKDYHVEPKTRSKNANTTKKEFHELQTIHGNSLTVSNTEPFFYVEGKNSYITVLNHVFSTYVIKDELKLIGYENVVMVPPYKLDTIRKWPVATSLDGLLPQKLKELKSDTELWIAIALYKAYHNHEYFIDKQYTSHFAKANPTHPLIRLIKLYKKGAHYSALPNFFDMLKQERPTTIIPKHIENLVETYKPFLTTTSLDSDLIIAYDQYLERISNA